jgi:putative addiction module CopG family antidote
MNIRLKPDTEQWLKSQVEQGRFGSVEEAVEALVREDQMTQEALDRTDLSWAQPYIDKGHADSEAGRVIPAEEVYADLRARFGRTRDS